MVVQRKPSGVVARMGGRERCFSSGRGGRSWNLRCNNKRWVRALGESTAARATSVQESWGGAGGKDEEEGIFLYFFKTARAQVRPVQEGGGGMGPAVPLFFHGLGWQVLVPALKQRGDQQGRGSGPRKP